MRRRSSFFWMLSILMVFAIAMTNCTKEGPAGPAGIDGTNGTDGTDGVDGNSACLNCHTQTKMDGIATSFVEHKHAIGDSWARGTSQSCGRCHSHDGFVEFARSGVAIAANVSTPLNCGSCHVNHTSLEDGIGAPMRMVASPVASVAIEGATYEHGMGNACASCHQARRSAASYYPSEDGTFARKFTGDDIAVYQAHAAVGPNGSVELVGDTLFVTFDVPVATHVYTNSTHAGPHHGPQANMFAADIGSVAGIPFDTDNHTDCVGCHLSNEEVGSGHTFKPNIATCNNCHGEGLLIESEMAEVAARMQAIEAALEAIGAIHVAEDGVHPMYASLPKDQWNAFWNYMVLWEDGANGIHNLGYTRQLLNQAETALDL